MKEYLNKNVRLSVNIDGKVLYYTCKITSVSDAHITFLDKFGDTKTKRIADIVEVEEDKQ